MTREISEELKQRARDIIAEEEAKKAKADGAKFSEDLLKRMESAHYIVDDEPSDKKRG